MAEPTAKRRKVELLPYLTRDVQTALVRWMQVRLPQTFQQELQACRGEEAAAQIIVAHCDLYNIVLAARHFAYACAYIRAGQPMISDMRVMTSIMIHVARLQKYTFSIFMQWVITNMPKHASKFHRGWFWEFVRVCREQKCLKQVFKAHVMDYTGNLQIELLLRHRIELRLTLAQLGYLCYWATKNVNTYEGNQFHQFLTELHYDDMGYILSRAVTNGRFSLFALGGKGDLSVAWEKKRKPLEPEEFESLEQILCTQPCNITDAYVAAQRRAAAYPIQLSANVTLFEHIPVRDLCSIVCSYVLRKNS